MSLLHYKALHIIFVVTWFAGLFYIVRLFIYHTEALQKDSNEKAILCKQFKLMEKRLWYGITWPSMVLTIIFGTLLIIENPSFLKQGYFHIKLGFVALLIIYHFICGYILNKLKSDQAIMSSQKLRYWNELASLFLVAIVFLIVLKNTIDMFYGIAGLVIFAVILMLAIRIYKMIRD